MNYLIYFILTLLLTRTAGPAGSGSDRVQKLFDVMESHFAGCREVKIKFLFYTCPSHLWPEILQNVIPTVKGLGKWIRRKMGTDVAIWHYLIWTLRSGIFNFDAKHLGEIMDEAKVWALLGRYLEFPNHHEEISCNCLLSTLDSLTDVDLGRVAKLPYHKDEDLFDEINELVNDPSKARLLDGLKRASRDDFEMSHMLRSLRRWLQSSGDLRGWIFEAAFTKEMIDIPIEQLRIRSRAAFDFREGQELRKLLKLVVGARLFRDFEKSKLLLQDALPQSLPDRTHLIDFLTRLGHEDEKFENCKRAINDALLEFQEYADWDGVALSNACVMKGLSKLSDEFFEEYTRLGKMEQIRLNGMLRNVGLPRLF